MNQNNTQPPPPAGYQPAIPLEYPKIKLQIAAIGALLVVTPLLLIVTWFLQGQPTTLPLNVGNVQDLFLVIVTLIITIVVHELIHGLIYQLLGYRVTYGVSLKLFAAYAGAFGQFQKRNHNLMVGLAPLIILTLALLPFLSISNQTVLLVVFTALLFNIGGAVGDMYLAGRLLQLPQASLLYDADVSTMLIYVPSSPYQKP